MVALAEMRNIMRKGDLEKLTHTGHIESKGNMRKKKVYVLWMHGRTRNKKVNKSEKLHQRTRKMSRQTYRQTYR